MAQKISENGTSETRNNLASNLKRLMYEHDLSQKDLATLIGVSGPTISAWCNGQKMPRPEMIDKLIDILHTDRANLLEKHTYRKPKEQDQPSGSFTMEDIMLAQRIARLDAYRKALIEHIIDTEIEQ